MTGSTLHRKLRAAALKQYRSALNARPVRLSTPRPKVGTALLYYVVVPFRGRGRRELPRNHTHHWESLQMARTLLELGYDVDVMSAWNRDWLPTRSYDLLVSSRWNVSRLAPHLDTDCIKVLHAETANITFQNAAEAARLLDLQQRRGATLTPRRWEVPYPDAEHADHLTILGNEFTQQTFAFADKPIHRVRGSSLIEPNWSSEKDFAAARTHFLWMGSWGLVLKGLDLILEAFAEMPDLELFVCGPTAMEVDFAREYQRELRDSPNIHDLGWIDVTSDSFAQLAQRCAAQVNFSASEGGGGAVITGMHAGFIPIVNIETSVDVHPEFGVLCETTSLDSIKTAIRDLATTPPSELRERSRRAWEHARSSHTREVFAADFRQAMEQIIGA